MKWINSPLIVAIVSALGGIGIALVGQFSLADKSICGIRSDDMAKLVPDFEDFSFLTREYFNLIEDSAKTQISNLHHEVEQLRDRLDLLKALYERSKSPTGGQAISDENFKPDIKSATADGLEFSKQILIDRNREIAGKIGRLNAFCLR